MIAVNNSAGNLSNFEMNQILLHVLLDMYTFLELF